VLTPRQPPETTAGRLFEQLRAQGVQLLVDGDRLRVTAATGVLNEQMQESIRRFKRELMELVLEDLDAATMDSAPSSVRLTPAQERLWLFQQLNPSATTYNISPIVHLDGPVDVERLQHALTSVARRHEPLRSVVGPGVEGEVIVALPSAEVPMPVVDLSSLSPEAQLGALAQVVQREQGRAFDLATERPFRATLVRRSATSFVLVTTMHHIAVDGASFAAFYRDLATYYGGGEPSALRTSYGEYAHWLQHYWTPERIARRAGFWREQLAGAAFELDMPSDQAATTRGGFNGGLVLQTLSASDSTPIQALAQTERASLFMLLLAAYAVVLHRHSGQRDVIVGTPLHGRDQEELSDLVGMFVNQLPLRVRVEPDATLRTVLRAAREVVLACMTAHELPFGAIVEAVDAPRDVARNPIFQVLLNLLPPVLQADGLQAAGVTFSLPGLHETLAMFDGQAKFDMTLYVVPRAKDLQLALVYDADRFQADRMSALLADITAVLREGVATPDVPLEQLDVFREDRDNIAASTGWKHADLGLEAGSVPEYIASHVAAAPERAAVIDASGDRSYRELDRDAQRIARLIAAATGDDVGQVVGVMVPHGKDSVSALLGVLRSGRAYVPLDPAYPEARLRFMIEDAGVRTILTTSTLTARVVEMLGAHGTVIDLADHPDERVPVPPLPSPDAKAYLLYTSGSTGHPKAVVQTHRNLLVQAHRYAVAVGIRPTDRLAWLASISFDASLMDIFGGLIGGAAICPIDARSLDLAQLPARLAEAGLTVLHVTPTVFRTIERSTNAPAFPTVRAVVLGGEAVRSEDIAFFDRRFRSDAQLLNLYGASEHSFSLGFHIDRQSRSREVPIGFPLGDTEVVLLDQSGRIDPVLGELALRSAHSAVGYWNAPDPTARAFVADPERAGSRLYRTGDIVRRRRDGALVFVRRADHQVKVRGHRVEPDEIEHRLRAHPTVLEVAVHAPLGSDGEAQLVACVVARPDVQAPAMPELAAWCADVLPAYMVPTAWVSMERLPRTPSGKIDRRALPSTAVGGRGTRVGPRDAEEAEVLAIWCAVLGTDDLGVTDNFFMSGGHSLTAMQVVTRIRDVFGVDFPVRQFFDRPTIADTAASVRANRDVPSVIPPITVRPKGDLTPLSFSQERLWFQQQLDLQATAYNMGGAALFEGPLDMVRMGRAFETVVRAEESLRTRIASIDGRAAAVVDPDPTHLLVVEDVESLPESERLDAARRLVESVVYTPYDLERGPLFRVVLVRLSPTRHLVGIGMHHVISDLWSFGVLSRLVREAYERDDGTVREAPGGLTYRDYALWQREWLEGEALEQQVAYWRATLDGAPTLHLPTDLPRPAFLTFDGASVRVDMEPDQRRRLHEVALAHRATPFMVLLAAFNLLLSRLTGQDDIVVGSPIAGRTASVTDDMIGTFVNTLVHRNSLVDVRTFADVIERVRHTALDAYAHQDVPFEVLVKSLSVPRDSSRSPLFQVLFNVANARMEAQFSRDTTQATVPLSRPAAQFDLLLTVGLNEVQSDVRLVYNINLFEEATARRLLDDYLDLLTRALQRPDRPLVELLQLTAAEQRRLAAWNSTGVTVTGADDLIARFVRQAEKTPLTIAVHAADGSYSYSELRARSEQVAAALVAAGVKAGDRVGVLLERRRDLPAALLGVLGAGAAYVPLDPRYPQARLRLMLEDAGVAVVVAQRTLLERLPGLGATVLLEELPASRAALTDAPPETPAYVIYTSGSTGTPKGVEITRGNVANFLLAMQERPGIEPDDVLLAVTTISFDIAVLELFLPLVVGAQVVVADEAEVLDGRRLAERMNSFGVTLMQATPATWKLLFTAGWRGDSRLRVLCGGEALPRALADQLLACVGQVWNMYGPTETTVWSTVDRVDAGPITIGRPIANTTLHVLDTEGRPVALGRPGELWIGGAGVAAGYVNRQELTEERFRAHPAAGGARLYRTGDLVRWRHDGRLEHLGRLDDQVKVRGFRIELGEVESAMRSHPAVQDAAATVDGERLLGFVVVRPGLAPTTSELRRAVADLLPPHMVPNQVTMLDALPLTPNGKLDRRAMSRLAGADGGDGAVDRDADSRRDDGSLDPRVRLLIGIWTDLLGQSDIHPDDNFFEVGGHSLLAMEVIAKVEGATGHRLEPRAMFFKTLRDLASMLPEQAGAST
jgi:amino acid adenylation domain-containing protein